MEKLLSRLRGLGWVVAAHNDYFLSGVLHTFWLFTNRDTERYIKVEGWVDDPGVLEEALRQAVDQCASAAACEEAMSD